MSRVSRVSVEGSQLRYYEKLVRVCRQLAALHVDSAYFDKITRGRFAQEKDNQLIRYALEDEIRDLLRRNGDFPR